MGIGFGLVMGIGCGLVMGVVLGFVIIGGVGFVGSILGIVLFLIVIIGDIVLVNRLLNCVVKGIFGGDVFNWIVMCEIIVKIIKMNVYMRDIILWLRGYSKRIEFRYERWMLLNWIKILLYILVCNVIN